MNIDLYGTNFLQGAQFRLWKPVEPGCSFGGPAVAKEVSMDRWPRQAWTRLTAVITVLIAAALGIVTVPAAAHASPATALQRCLSAGVPNVDVTITHPGNVISVGYPNVADQWNVIYPGDVINIISGGSVRYDYWGASTGPGGLAGQFGDASFPFPGYPKVASVIRFNNNPAGWVGNPDLTVNWSGCHQWNSPYPVRVGFYVNDNNPGDNGGAWNYRILHYYP